MILLRPGSRKRPVFARFLPIRPVAQGSPGTTARKLAPSRDFLSTVGGEGYRVPSRRWTRQCSPRRPPFSRNRATRRNPLRLHCRRVSPTSARWWSPEADRVRVRGAPFRFLLPSARARRRSLSDTPRRPRRRASSRPHPTGSRRNPESYLRRPRRRETGPCDATARGTPLERVRLMVHLRPRV